MPRPITQAVITFANTGIITKSTPDEIPITAYKLLSNAHTDRENSVSVRKGFARLNAGLPAPPYSSYYMKDSNHRQWRYAITNGQLYVAPIDDPEDAVVWPLASHTNFGSVIGGANLSSAIDPRALWATFSLSGSEVKPYAFLADGTVFLKHSGGLASARRVGIPRPTNPILSMSVSAVSDELIDECEDITLWSGGNSSLTSAPDYPSIWWYGTGSMDARWYYAKYTFVLNDGSETYASSANNPGYIPRLKTSKMFWKPTQSTYQAETPAGNSSPTVGTYFYINYYFNDAVYTDISPNIRVRGVRIQSGDMVDRIQVLWEKSDGTIMDGPFHGGGHGNIFNFMLDFDEYIIGLKGRYGDYLDSLTIVTNKRESQKFGGDGGSYDYSVTLPASTSTQAKMMMGFCGRYAGPTAFSSRLTSIGFATRYDGYNDSKTPPVNATGWNLYVGDSPNNLYKVNDTAIGLTSVYTEPPGGFTYLAIRPPVPNVGDLTADPSGSTDKGIKISLSGSGKLGRAIRILTNEVGYPVIENFGSLDPEESFKFSIKFADAEAKSNCDIIRLIFVLSDIPGDTGDKYNYLATAELTDFSSHTPGAWQQVQVDKSSFVLNNQGGLSSTGLGWDSVSALIVEVVTEDPATGGETCVVSFDSFYYSPRGKLNGSDLEWTYTYYNSKTDTESDYADPFSNTLGSLSDARIALSFPSTPLTNPPMADPDKIRIYRMGGTITQFQRVDEIDYIPGFPFSYTDNVDDTELGDVLETDNQLPPEEVEGVEIFDNRLWTWGGVSLEGVLEPLNVLRFSKGTRVEHFPANNRVIVGSGNEQIMRVLEHDGELFVFTLTKVYRIVGQDGDYRAQSTAVNQGLVNKFCACRGTRGLYMRSHDGIYEFPAGRKISEPINGVFFGETINGIEPVASGREAEESMGFMDSKIVFSYCSTTDPAIRNDRMLVWDTLYERWAWRIYGAQNLYAEPETNILIGDNLTQWYSVIPGTPVTVRRSGNYPIQLDTGYADQCADPDDGSLISYGIPVIIDTKEYDLGYPDQEKLFIDLTVDADTQGYPVQIQASFDGEDFEVIGVIQTATRERVIFPIILGEENGKMAVRMSVRLSFESDPSASAATRIYKIIHRFLLEPPRHRTHVTDWDYNGHAGPKYYTSFWVEMDTFGVPLEAIEIWIDQVLKQTITENITTSGRLKQYYGLDVDTRGTISRVKFITAENSEVKIYEFGFEVMPEPALLNTIQTPWTDNGFPYRKLWKHIELDIDTEGKTLDFNFWLDNEIVQTFSLSAASRQHIVQSLDSNLFGKIGRLTVSADPNDVSGDPQGVRLYSAPIFITVQRNPDVTLADSFEQTLNYEKQKVLKRIYYVLENPNEDVLLQIYIEGRLRHTVSLAANGSTYPDIAMRRQDLPGALKGKFFRFIFSSNQAFEIDWPHSQLVVRDVDTEDTYRRPPLDPPKAY